jgi:TrpR-related protein YerC/YecD
VRTNFYNGNIKRLDKLTVLDKQDLLTDLLISFQILSDPEEVALFLQDLFTQAEIQFFSKRLRIAKLLLANRTYVEIQTELHVSHGTVAKVAIWLRDKGDGFRNVISKISKISKNSSYQNISELEKFIRRYPRYFWPHILAKEMNISKNKAQQHIIQQLMDNLAIKSQRDEELRTLTHNKYKVLSKIK